MTESEKNLSRPGFTDLDLLRALQGCKLAKQLKTLYAIGTHRFDEKGLIEYIFPSLRTLVLFEPLPEPRAVLEDMAKADARIKVFPYAISNENGVSDFRVSSNAGESSSLLKLGTHQEIFPHVKVSETVRVETRRLNTVIEEHHLPYPDLLIIDVQGAEYMVLSALDEVTLDHVRLIYTEVSTEAVYQDAKTLGEIETLLAPRFQNMGYAPLMANTPMHGNAIFVKHEDTAAALAPTARQRLRRLLGRV